MLTYLGGGYIPGIPARDLNADEVKKHGKKMLLESGLYAIPKTKEKAEKVRKGAEVNDGNR